MIVGVLEMELYIPGASSLKEKRMVLQSLVTRIRKKYNVSIEETDHLDKWQRATLGIAKVSKDTKSIDRVFNFIDLLVEQDGRSEIVSSEFEYLK